MRKLLRFCGLSFSDRLFFLKAFFLLGAMRIVLFVIPFNALRRFIERAKPASNVQEPDEAALDKISWLVRAAARLIPGSEKCLSEALVTQALLRQEGFPAIFKIGVTKSEKEKFGAHAWVESCGKIVIGGKNTSQYTPLLALNE